VRPSFAVYTDADVHDTVFATDRGFEAVEERSTLADIIRRNASCPACCPDLTRPVPYPLQISYGDWERPVLAAGPADVLPAAAAAADWLRGAELVSAVQSEAGICN